MRNLELLETYKISANFIYGWLKLIEWQILEGQKKTLEHQVFGSIRDTLQNSAAADNQ